MLYLVFNTLRDLLPSKRERLLENIVLRQQINVLCRTNRGPKFSNETPSDRV